MRWIHPWLRKTKKIAKWGRSVVDRWGPFMRDLLQDRSCAVNPKPLVFTRCISLHLLLSKCGDVESQGGNIIKAWL
jgi:hypothetical protein